MLTIRPEQMLVFEAYAIKRFEDALWEHLSSGHPEKIEELGEEKSRKIVRQGIETARQFSVDVERDVAAFVEYMFEVDPRWHELEQWAWALDILNDPALDGHAKMELIDRTARDLS